MAETDDEKATREAAEATAAEEAEAAQAAKDAEEAGWTRLSELVGKTVEEKLSSWSGPKEKKTTSSSLPQKQVQKGPARKKGFLSGQFFSGLTDQE
jgi:hypothetical protein